MYEYLVDSIRVAKKGKVSKATLMDNSNQELIQKKPYLFMVAAVSDYIPEFPQEGKLKKEILGSKWNLDLVENIDILSSLDKSDIYTIGFKAEMDKSVAFDNGKNMMEKKTLDGVCLNTLIDSSSFGSNTNEIELILKNGSFSFKGQKLDISIEILEKLEKEFSKND